MHSSNSSPPQPASSQGHRPTLNGHSSHTDATSQHCMESPDASGGELDNLLRKRLLHPEFQAGLSIVRLIHGTPDVREFPQVCHQLLDLDQEICRGGRAPALRIAMTQAATLDVTFHKLLQLAYEKIETPEGQRLLKLAFRAQAQCARILTALPRLGDENPGHRAKPKVNAKTKPAPSVDQHSPPQPASTTDPPKPEPPPPDTPLPATPPAAPELGSEKSTADSIPEQSRPEPAEVPVPKISSVPAMPPEPAPPAKPVSPFARPPGWKPAPWPPTKPRNSNSQRHG